MGQLIPMSNKELVQQIITAQGKSQIYKVQLATDDFLVDFSQSNYIKPKIRENFTNSLQKAFDEKKKWFQVYGMRFATPYVYNSRKKISSQFVNKNIQKYLLTVSNQPKDFFSQQLEKGQIKITNSNNEEQTVNAQYKLQLGDTVQYRIEDHLEPPIYNIDPTIIHEDEELLIVDKPVSMSVITSQRYFRNSIPDILRYKGLHHLKHLYCPDIVPINFSGLSMQMKDIVRNEVIHNSNFGLQKYSGFEKKCFVRVMGNFPSTTQIAKSYPNFSFNLLEYDPISDTSLLDGTQSFKKEIPDLPSSSSSSSQSTVNNLNLHDRNINIKSALRELNFPILNDTVHGGRFVGNMWLELRNQREFDDLTREEYNLQIKNQAPANLYTWSINKVFEQFVHYYHLCIDDSGKKTTFESKELPYWHDAHCFQNKKFF